MQAITRFNMATSFPINEEATFAQIAESCGVNELDVRRILRHAMTKRIFHEPREGVVAHTAASRLMSEDSQVSDWVGASTDDLWQAAAQTVNAMVKYPGSQEPNQTVFDPLNYSQDLIGLDGVNTEYRDSHLPTTLINLHLNFSRRFLSAHADLVVP